jgi:hypothetical protein
VYQRGKAAVYAQKTVFNPFGVFAGGGGLFGWWRSFRASTRPSGFDVGWFVGNRRCPDSYRGAGQEMLLVGETIASMVD